MAAKRTAPGPADPQALTDAEWAEFLFMRAQHQGRA